MNTNSSHEDILLNSIWIEMKQANTNKYYSELLIDQHFRRSKWFTIFSTGFSIGGAALSFINDIFPIAACTALGVAEILKLIFPYYIMKPDELSRLSSLSITYDSYFIKLKKIFDSLHCYETTSSKAELQYRTLYTEYSQSREEISRIFGKIDTKMNKKASAKSDDYLNKIYHYGKD